MSWYFLGKTCQLLHCQDQNLKKIWVSLQELPKFDISLIKIGKKYTLAQTEKTRCNTLMPKKLTYTLRVDQSGSKSVKKCSAFIIFKFLRDAASKMCRLEFRFQNLPFQNLLAKNVSVSCEREADPSNFSPFSKCAGIV